MSTNGLLTEKEQELVAVGASTAAGCRPCTAYHVRAARAAGADKEEIRQAVNGALNVRHSASDIMARLAAKYLGDAPAEEAPHGSEQSLMGELVSVGAALAVNCAVSLETHLTAAYQLGATVRQIQTALDIARAVKNMAAKKADETITKIAGESQVCAHDCGCHDAQSQPSSAPAGCGCDEVERAATA
jgi:AhpD family alkylhydroperoxidase